MFIWDKDYLGTHIPVLASLAMLECFFENFRLQDYFAKVSRENSVAVRYNLTLGFRLHETSNDSSFDIYVLEKENYLKASEKLKRFAATISNEKPQLQILPELLNELQKLMS